MLETTRKGDVMKTLIAVPCHDMIHTSFVRSLQEMDKPGQVSIGYIQGTLIYEARNVIASNAINDGFDRVLWLDSDMMVPKDAMKRLAAHLNAGKEMVSGLYFGRRNRCNPMIQDKLDWSASPDGNVSVESTSYLDFPKNALFEIAGCGFGCVMTSVRILKDMVEKYGAPFTPMLGMGEDVSFCWRARQHGYKIYCDSTLTLGHIGQYVYDEADFTARRGDVRG